MSQPLNSAIAQLLFCEAVPVTLPELAADLDAVLCRTGALDRSLTWDCEDIVFFDLPGTRLTLSWLDHPGQGIATCLTLSVGPSPHLTRPGFLKTSHQALCSRLVERLQLRCKPAAIVWHQTEGAVTADVLDALNDTLPTLPDLLAPGDPVICPPPASAEAAPEWQIANDTPDLPRERNAELARVRAALYPPAEQAPPAQSIQLRLAAHAMNATLIVVYAPLGAAVMTYSLLRGEDMRISARLMVLVGLLAGFGQSNLGQNMAAMAGV